MTALHPSIRGRTLLSGAVAGSLTSVGFAALHHVLISDIWFSLLPMTAAGALCGLCLAWSYRQLSARPSAAGWLLYNLLYVALFVVLGAVSFLVYEPVYTITGLVAGTEPIGALVRQAAPLIVAFGFLCAAGISLVRARTAATAISVTVTCVVLTVLLGHNAAVLGMVHMTRAAVPLLALFYGLFAAIMAGNAAVFLLLERRSLFAPGPHAVPGEPRNPAPATSPAGRSM